MGVQGQVLVPMQVQILMQTPMLVLGLVWMWMSMRMQVRMLVQAPLHAAVQVRAPGPVRPLELVGLPGLSGLSHWGGCQGCRCCQSCQCWLGWLCCQLVGLAG